MSTSVRLNNAQGQLLAEVPFTRLKYILSTSQVGAAEIDVPPNMPAVERDYQLEILRSVDNGPQSLEGGKRWLIRKVRRTYAEATTVTWIAVCPNDLLCRRIIAYDTDTAFTDKTGAADDLMKAIVRQNFTASIDSSRDVTGSANIGTLFSVQGDTGEGASLSVACARDNVLETIRKLCEASVIAGTYLAFDVVWTGAIFEFQTFINQRGADHRYPTGINPVILGQAFGNVATLEVLDNYETEASVVIAGAQGIGSTRTIATATDAVRVDASPFNHIEVFEQANASGYDPTVTADRADARLRAGRPVRLVTGRMAETGGTRYGRDWGWGDRLTVQVEGANYDARIDSVTITIENGKEDIDAGVRIDA